MSVSIAHLERLHTPVATWRVVAVLLLAGIMAAGTANAVPPAPEDDLLWIDQLEQLDLELMDLDGISDAQSKLDSSRIYASITLGRDNRDNRVSRVSLQLPVGEPLAFDAAWGESRINDNEPSYTTRHRQLGIGSNFRTGFNWHIGADDWGKDGAIETADTLFELSYRSGSRWNFALQYETGDVSLYTRPMFSSRLVAIQSDREAWGISTGHATRSGAWWASYLKRNYERNLPALNTSLVLQAIIQSAALDQAYALSRKEAALGYEWYVHGADISIEYSRVISEIDNASSDYLALSLRYYLGDSINLQTSLQDSLGEGIFTLNLGVGVLW